MRYTVNAESFLEIPVTTGTIQNVSNTDIEVSNEEVVGSGLILKAGEMVGFNNTTVYVCARPVLEGGTGIISVVPFSIKGEGGGGGSYVLPIATKTVLGGVKSSTDDGKVAVGSDGTMSVNQLGYRKPSTAYAVGNIKYHSTLPTGWYLECVTAGTSASGNLTITSPAIGNTVTDGTVTWKIGMPLSQNGGTMTGSILHKDSEWFNIYGGQSSTVASGIIQLGSPAVDGRVNIIAKGADSTSELLAYPDGKLKWNGNDIVALYSNAAAHNSIYRGKDLTAYMESGGMSTAIANGTFTDIFPGDYVIKSVTIDGITYNDVKWVVMDLDYFLYTSNTILTTHHIVLMPENTLMLNTPMNDTNTTAGGYKGSKIWTTTIPLVDAGIDAAFGSAHVLSHNELLSNAIDTTAKSRGFAGWTGAASAWEWLAVKSNIPNEPMVYGDSPCSSSLFDVGNAPTQLAAFKYNPALRCAGRRWFWTRAIASSSGFAGVYGGGDASYLDAAHSGVDGGVRPYFLYK